MSSTVKLEFHKQEIIDKIIERFNNDKCAHVERMLSIMSNPTRFYILCALSEDAFTVSELVTLTNSKLSNISQQLKIMTLAGYLDKERKGQQVFYRLADTRIRELILVLESLFAKED